MRAAGTLTRGDAGGREQGVTRGEETGAESEKQVKVGVQLKSSSIFITYHMDNVIYGHILMACVGEIPSLI